MREFPVRSLRFAIRISSSLSQLMAAHEVKLQAGNMMQTNGHAAGHSNQASDIFAPVALHFGGPAAGKSVDGLPSPSTGTRIMVPTTTKLMRGLGYA